MKEVVFVNRNKERWKEFDSMASSGKKQDPDVLADLFIQVLNDLSYARTFYPKGNVPGYLNQLAFKAHQLIYKNKKEKRSRILSFWKYEFPLEFLKNQKYFYYSCIIFFISLFIGLFSAALDDTYVRLILGDQYVNLTIENIKNGDPMAIYKHMTGTESFIRIWFNNAYVTIQVFALGLIFSVGAAMALMYNGIMIGAFQYFFYAEGHLADSMSIIWLHGTIEIFSILVAGGAGLMIGNSLMFPGTYPRLHSLKVSAVNALKLVIGILPFITVAAFIEGYVTRHTHMPWILRIMIIGGSVVMLYYYFFIYPRILKTKQYGKQCKL